MLLWPAGDEILRFPNAQNAIVFRELYLQFSNYLRAALQFAYLEQVGCDW